MSGDEREENEAQIRQSAGHLPLCACGSGLSAARCCAQQDDPFFDASLHGDLAQHELQAADALKLGDRALAEQLSLGVLEAQPRRVLALATLAELRIDQRQFQAAHALLTRLAELEPQNVWPVNKLAMLELARGNAGAAETHARQSVRLAPDNAQSHNLMAMVMTRLGRATVGEFHGRRALELAGQRIPLVLANLATNLTALGRITEARALYAEADALAPNNRQTLMAWARMEEADRKLEPAAALLDRAAATSPRDDAGITLMRVAILGRQNRQAEAIALLEGSAAAQSRPLQPVERLERGRLLDRLGRYDEAWDDFVTAKARLRELTGQSYLEEEAAGLAARLRAFFQRSQIESLPRIESRMDAAQPIFILGFPRSGTTLLEQMLTTSPVISAGDELPLVAEIAATMPRLLNSPLDYPGALSELWMGDGRGGVEVMRDYYLRRVGEIGLLDAGSKLFTDKMPLNEVHIGLIALLFPKAPLLHVVRHPLDIMVSAMSNGFTHGGFCGTALESAAKHLLLSADLVAHYRREMALNYLEVRYEDMVDNQETTMRRVFDFVGVPFEPAALSFERNERYARTASYAQVSEPLYRRSRRRYENYRLGLEAAEQILAPLIQRLGYGI